VVRFFSLSLSRPASEVVDGVVLISRTGIDPAPVCTVANGKPDRDGDDCRKKKLADEESKEYHAEKWQKLNLWNMLSCAWWAHWVYDGLRCR
jgi:hypothetical protein